jgi:hypothetical protein
VSVEAKFWRGLAFGVGFAFALWAAILAALIAGGWLR